MFGDFSTGPNAPRKRSRVAQGIHIGKRRSIPNAHSMRIFGCSIRHSTFARSVAIQTTPLWRREYAGSTVLHPGRPEFIPQRGPRLHPDHLATPDLRHSRTISQLFCDCGLSWAPLIADHGAKAQVIGRTAAYFRLEGAEKSPQSQKSCKNGGIFVFDGPIVAIGQIQQRANRPNRADPLKDM